MTRTPFWSEPAADRGWLLAPCEPYRHDTRYTYATLPVSDARCGWREQSTLGYYLDYGPDSYRSPAGRIAEPGNVHAVSYAARTSHHFVTIAEAREWVEAQTRNARPELFKAQEVAA